MAQMWLCIFSFYLHVNLKYNLFSTNLYSWCSLVLQLRSDCLFFILELYRHIQKNNYYWLIIRNELKSMEWYIAKIVFESWIIYTNVAELHQYLKFSIMFLLADFGKATTHDWSDTKHEIPPSYNPIKFCNFSFLTLPPMYSPFTLPLPPPAKQS